MTQWGSPPRVLVAHVGAATGGKVERRWLLPWRGVAAVLVLAVYTAVGIVQAVLALVMIAGRPIAGRRAGAADLRGETARSGRQALPG